MKLVFTKLETDANEIRVTFNGSIWRPYSVADIKKTGYIEFTEEDCPDLTKIRVKGKFASFNSVEAVSDVELEQGLASRSLAESVQRIDSFISSTVSETNKLVDESTLNDSLVDIESTLEDKADKTELNVIPLIYNQNTDILAYALTCPQAKRTLVRIHSANATNNPFGITSDTDFIYEISKVDSANAWIYVKAKDVRTNREFINTRNDVKWLGWQELATMDKVAKYPNWSDQQKINQTEITLDQDVYIELNQLSADPTENLKINGKDVSVSDFSNGLYSTRFSGYVKKGSVVSYPYLNYNNLVRVFPLV